MAPKGFFSSFDDIWMLDGVRTPMVDYCGALGHISPTDLGIKAARAALSRAGVPGEHVGSVIAGNMAPGDFEQFMLPRHIGLYAGVPVEVPALMAQRICGTGFELFRQAGEQIQSGACEAARVVGSESMTRNPIASFEHRNGFKLGAPVGFKDFMWEALKDSAAGINMIQTAENLAVKYGVKREQVDEFASNSFAKALAAQQSGFHAGEIVPVISEKFELEGYQSRGIKLQGKLVPSVRPRCLISFGRVRFCPLAARIWKRRISFLKSVVRFRPGRRLMQVLLPWPQQFRQFRRQPTATTKHKPINRYAAEIQIREQAGDSCGTARPVPGARRRVFPRC